MYLSNNRFALSTPQGARRKHTLKGAPGMHPRLVGCQITPLIIPGHPIVNNPNDNKSNLRPVRSWARNRHKGSTKVYKRRWLTLLSKFIVITCSHNRKNCPLRASISSSRPRHRGNYPRTLHLICPPLNAKQNRGGVAGHVFCMKSNEECARVEHLPSIIHMFHRCIKAKDLYVHS